MNSTAPRAHTITGFCAEFKVSRSQFYELVKAGLAPRVYYIGRRGFISDEAAERWQREMEARGRTEVAA